MGRRLEARDADELALDDKLDLARTLLAYGKRVELRHEKNRVEAAIKQAHREEVNRGKVTAVAIPSADEIISLYGQSAPALGAGTEEAESAARNTNTD